MEEKLPHPSTVTGKIYRSIFDLLEQHPEGIRWTDLNSMLIQKHPDFHPKTINGCVWMLTQRFSKSVHKPEKGRFQLLKKG